MRAGSLNNILKKAGRIIKFLLAFCRINAKDIAVYIFKGAPWRPSFAVMRKGAERRAGGGAQIF